MDFLAKRFLHCMAQHMNLFVMQIATQGNHEEMADAPTSIQAVVSFRGRILLTGQADAAGQYFHPMQILELLGSCFGHAFVRNH